jgi:3-hydroxyisobutyrate dehydrogenase-like beta-hydroxyacid dehydrogenase
VTGFAVVGLGGMGSRIAADSDAGHEVIVDRSHERIASGGPGASRR